MLIELFSLGVTAESLPAKRYRKSAISPQRGHFDPKFQVEGVAPTNHFCTDSQANECLTTLSLTVFTQRNFVGDFLQAKCDFPPKTVFLRFEPCFGGLGATYDDHLRLIGVLIELFSLDVTAEALRANISSKLTISLQWGPVDPKFQVEGVAPTNYSSCHKLGKWSFMRYKNAGTTFFRFVTVHAYTVAHSGLPIRVN